MRVITGMLGATPHPWGDAMDAILTDRADLSYSQQPPVLIAASSDAALARAVQTIEATGLRVGGKVDIEEALERIERQVSASALWLELDRDCGGPLDELIRQVNRDVAEGRYAAVVSTTVDLLDPLAATIDNQARLNLTANNRYAELEKEWAKGKTISSIRLRVQQPERKDFVSVVLSRNANAVAAAPVKDRTQELLDAAKASFKAGDDDAALESLRKIVSSDPMAAEAYILLGKISLKRGDKDQAISQFKTAIFWDNKLVEAHVNLGKIYVDKGDCLQAKNYAASAAEVDSENIDVQALQRMTERCSK